MLSNLKRKLRTCFKNSLPQYNIKIILYRQTVFLLFSVLKMLFLKSYSLTQNINFCAVTAMLLTMAKLSAILKEDLVST